MDDRLPVYVKPITSTGAQHFGQAKRLGMTASRAEAASKNHIHEGYILRAVRKSERYNVYIIDPPAMLLFAGYAFDTRDELGSVGNRDEFQDKDSTKTYKLARESAEETRTVLPVPAIPIGEIDTSPTVYEQEFAPQTYEQGVMAIGYRRVPMALISSVGQMDTYDHFTYAQNVSLGLAITLPQASISKAIGQFRSNYLSLNTFWFGERQMADGWALQARRLIDRLRYAPNSPYNSTRLPICLMAGGSVIPAVSPSTEDQYVVVGEAVRQSRATWSIGSDTYYDLVGERGLVIARAIADREDFDPENPVAVRAVLDSVRYITAADLPRDDIKPAPANYYGFPANDSNIVDPGNPPPAGVPLLPTFSWWLNPQAVRYTDQSGAEGFATFCVYWGPNHVTATNPQPLSFGRPDQYMSAAIVVVDNDFGVRVLKADLNDISYSDPGWRPIEGADSDKFVNPWLIGTESVARTDTDGVVTRTGYALVWEEWQLRGAGGSGFPDGPPPGETPTNDATDNITLGGEFTLYSIGKDGLQRTVLTGDCAAMVHPNMGPPARFGFPVSTSYLVPPTGNTSEPWFTDKNGYGACYYMGDNKLVTACIPNERYYMYTYSPGTSGNGSYGYNQQVDPHPVSCAVIDTVTGLVEVRGVIAERSWADQFCTITCAQWTIPAKGDKEEQPAVLLAGFHTNIKAYFPDYDPPSDCTYISIDGGWTWRLYIEDAAGEKGQFLVGNQLWSNDPSIRIDSGEKAT